MNEELKQTTKIKDELQETKNQLKVEKESGKKEVEELQRQLTRAKNNPQVKEIEKSVIHRECEDCKREQYKKRLVQQRVVLYGSIIYSFVATLVTLIRSDIVKADLSQAFTQTIKTLKNFFKWADGAILKLANLIKHDTWQNVVHVAVWIVIAAIVGFLIYRLIVYLKDCNIKLINPINASILLADLVLLAYLPAEIKSLTGANIILFFCVFLAGYLLIRIIIKLIMVIREYVAENS